MSSRSAILTRSERDGTFRLGFVWPHFRPQRSPPDGLSQVLKKAVGIKDKLLGCSLVERRIAFGGVTKRKNRGIYDFCNGQAIMQDGLHELAVVLQHRRLASVEAVRFRPAEAAVARPTGPAPAT